MKEGFDQSGPFFSVIIPVYNAEGFIRECLNSLLDQDFTNWEAVMVDDCSKDRSLKLIEEMVGHDSRFRVLRHEKNKGAAAARNFAINQARGLWCCFLDSDNQMRPGYMREVYEKVSALDDRYGIFWTGCRRIHHYPGDRIKEEDSVFMIPSDKPYSKVDFLKNLRVGTGTGLSVKRKCLLEAGLFDESLKAAEDTDLMYRLIWTCYVACSNKVLFNYHIYHDKADRLTTNFKSQFASYQVIHRKNLELLKQHHGLNKRVLSKLIRYAIFSRQPRSVYKEYVTEYINRYGRMDKLIGLYYLASLPFGGMFISLYKKISELGK